jgi:hypothetical protein
MATVDLVYDPDCPNVSLARTNLMRAFSRAGMQPQWSEHRIGDRNAPERVRGYGSPTVLVDGRDVAGFEVFRTAYRTDRVTCILGGPMSVSPVTTDRYLERLRRDEVSRC